MSLRTNLIGLAVLMALATGQANATTLSGSTVSMKYYFPDAGTLFCDNGSTSVGAGAEFPDYCGSSLTSVDVTDSQIIIDSTAPYNAASFNGFVLSFTGAPSITGLLYNAVSTLGITGFSFSDSTLTFNFSGQGEGRAIFDVALKDTPAVPVPAALPLLASGLGVLGVLGLRRKRKQAQL